MIESANIKDLKCGDSIEVEFRGFALKGEFIRFHNGEVRFMNNGSVVTTQPNKINYINGKPILR